MIQIFKYRLSHLCSKAQKGWMSHFKINRTILFVFLFIQLFRIDTTVSAQNQNIQISNSKNQLNNLSAIDFVDGLKGWFVGSGGTVVHTPDGGQTWQLQNVGQNVFLTAVDFISANEGWVGGAACCNTSSGIIFHTVDGGVSWEVVHEDPLGAFETLTFIDSDYGWAGGLNSNILYTTNGGQTWEKSTPNFPGSRIFSIVFIDKLNGWAEGIASGIFGLPLLFTHDGGKSWKADSTITSAQKVAFTDSLHGWAVGTTKLWRTIDGGNNWELYSFPFEPTLQFQNMFFFDDLFGYVISETGTFASKDGGITWSLVSKEGGTAVYFTSRNVGWGVWVAIGGFNAKNLAYTTNGGRTWNEVVITSVNQSLEITNNPVEFSLQANYPNPFNAETTIPFQIYKPNTRFNLSVYDQLGHKVVTLLDTILPTGFHQVFWQGQDNTGMKVPSGIYFYKLSSGNVELTRRMLLLQ